MTVRTAHVDGLIREHGQVCGVMAAGCAATASLESVDPLARELYTSGWRPSVPDGPTHDELAEVCESRAVEIA